MVFRGYISKNSNFKNPSLKKYGTIRTKTPNLQFTHNNRLASCDSGARSGKTVKCA